MLPIGSNFPEGVFFTQMSVYVEDSRGLTPPALFQVTKGNKNFAKTAINRNLKAFTLIARRAFIYGLLEVFEPLLKVATLTGFEPVLPP